MAPNLAPTRQSALRTTTTGRRLHNIRITAAVTHGRTRYVARCLDVEVTSQGERVEAAPGSLREALEPCEDLSIPDRVDTPIIAPVDEGPWPPARHHHGGGGSPPRGPAFRIIPQRKQDPRT